jgi:hypothetical protein
LTSNITIPVPKTEPVPLLTWGYAVMFAAVLSLWVFSLILKNTPPSEAFFLHNAERLERFAERTRAGTAGVVMLGDSRLRFGTYDDQRLGRELTADLGRPVEVVRIINNWAVFDDFAQLVPLILDAKPSLVVLQEGLLAKNRAQPARLFVGRAYLRWRFFGAGPWSPHGADQRDMQLEVRCSMLPDIDVMERKKRVDQMVRFDPKGDNARQAANFVKDATARGVAIGRKVFPTFERHADLEPLVLPIDIPDELFCDGTHMNPQARVIYSTWFIAAIGKLLQDSGS